MCENRGARSCFGENEVSQMQQGIAFDAQTPWAQPVPDAPFPATIADLQRLPDDEWLYELVEGRLVRMPGSASEATRIAAYLIAALVAFVRPRKLGSVTSSDGAFDLTLPGDTTETALIPDVAFVRAGRLAPIGTPEARKYPKLAPDLAVEIVSPSQFRPEMATKARLYLARGVRLVWIIWPETKQVDVWRPGSADAVMTLSAMDDLDGFDVLPGFTHPIADLFEE